MTKLFESLAEQNNFVGLSKAEFAKRAAHFLADLNAIHPFREGNGRTQLSFLGIIAEEAGHPLDFDRLEPGKVLSAIIESFGGDEDNLRRAITDLSDFEGIAHFPLSPRNVGDRVERGVHHAPTADRHHR